MLQTERIENTPAKRWLPFHPASTQGYGSLLRKYDRHQCTSSARHSMVYHQKRKGRQFKASHRGGTTGIIHLLVIWRNETQARSKVLTVIRRRIDQERNIVWAKERLRRSNGEEIIFERTRRLLQNKKKCQKKYLHEQRGVRNVDAETAIRPVATREYPPLYADMT